MNVAIVVQCVLTISCLKYSTSTELVRRQITTSDHLEAICNDGTTPVYYHSQGAQNNTKYIVFLEGGNFCNTAPECNSRCAGGAYLCSTMTDTDVNIEGCLSEDPAVNPLFLDYYKVWYHYCSSDMYIGESVPTPENGNWHFQGRANIEGLITSLQTHAGLAAGDQLVLTGGSAGGRGVAFNCEHVAAMLPGVDVRCVVDSAIFYPRFDTPPFDAGCQDFNEMISESNAFWNGTVNNFDVDTWWVTMTMPLFIGELVFDDYGFIYFCGSPGNPEHAQIWADGMYSLVQQLMVEAPHVGLYLPGCFGHDLLLDNTWWSSTPAGNSSITYVATMTNWLDDDPDRHTWDDCTINPYNCNEACPGEHHKIY